MTDDEAYDALEEIDELAEMQVTSWEAEFISDLLDYRGPLSDAQRAVIEGMAEKYLWD